MKADNSKVKGPQFVAYFMPILEALREMGGSAKPQEIIERIATQLKVTETQQQEKTKTGVPRFANKVHWARQYLVWAGLLDSSKHGVWGLTENGWKASFTQEEAVELFKKTHKARATVKTDTREPVVNEEVIETTVPEGYKEELLKVLQGLPPKGFEHFTKRLLREFGFERVEVTGGPKDKGLDGHGVLKVNPFVSFRVVFQCKRYADAVTSSQVATFRGSIPDNADKGLLITTGYFTSDATKLAQEPGLRPIELVDGDQIVALMEKLQLGLKATYKVDEDFFDEFREGIK